MTRGASFRQSFGEGRFAHVGAICRFFPFPYRLDRPAHILCRERFLHPLDLLSTATAELESILRSPVLQNLSAVPVGFARLYLCLSLTAATL